MKLKKKLKIIALPLLLIGTFTFSLSTQAVSAFSGSDFKAGRITDDAIFFSAPNMSIADIQNFLNAKVPNCDTWGTKPHGGTTRAAYAASKGVSAPFTCLRDYWQNTPNRSAEVDLCNGYGGGNHSAASIIYWVGESCGINPRVLLVLLQKEQSLVTDDWPWPIQYRSATGFGCPDTAPCDAEYYGFFNQVYTAARQYKRYARDANSYNYRAARNNRIYYNPGPCEVRSGGRCSKYYGNKFDENGKSIPDIEYCGSTTVYIENQATAGLYVYTPYQPNSAALNNLYGTGDKCSAYGNRNYWRMYYDWFGNPTNNAYAWEVIKEPGVNKLYFVNNRTRYWIPGPSINEAWGLDDHPYKDVDSSYFNSLHSGPNLNYVGLDVTGTRYLMNGGKKYLLPNDNYVLLWGVAGVPHVPAPGYIAQTISGGSVGRFATVDGTTKYLLNGNQKHLGVNAQSLSKWGISGTNTTTVSQDILDRFTAGPSVDRYVTDGTSKYTVDSSKAYRYPKAAIEHAWGLQSYIAIPSYALNLLSKSDASTFVRAENDSRWYFLENGNKHYVPSPAHATIWGWGSSRPLVVISADLMDQFTASSNLGYLVNSPDGKTYLMDGGKRQITSQDVANNIKGSSVVPTFSEVSLSDYYTGSSVNSNNASFSGAVIYSFDNGSLRGIPSFPILDAVGSNRNHRVVNYSYSLGSLIPKASSISYVVKDSSGNGYYLENGYKFAINPTYNATWQVSQSPEVSAAFLGTMTDSSKTIGMSVSYSGRRYLVSDRKLLEVTSDYSNYSLSSNNFEPISRAYMPWAGSSHLVGTPGNNKIWLLASGKRYHIPSYGMLLDLGYGTTSGITSLSANIISQLPESSQYANRVLRSPSTGSIFAMGGKGYGFLDSPTLAAYKGDSDIMVVPESVFYKFAFSGWARRVAYGTDGKIYLIENGSKRWITGPSILYSRYGNIPWLFMPQSSIDAFPAGLNIY